MADHPNILDFDPAARSVDNLHEEIIEIAGQSNKQAGEMIVLTWVIAGLTLAMLIGLGIQIYLARNKNCKGGHMKENLLKFGRLALGGIKNNLFFILVLMVAFTSALTFVNFLILSNEIILDPKLISIISVILVPIIIALLSTVLGYIKWRTDKMRLKNELFQRRYEKFEYLRNFMRKLASGNTVERVDENEFLDGTRGMTFLFSKSIDQFKDTVWDKSQIIWVAQQETTQGSAIQPTERQRYLEERTETIAWFNRELISLDDQFRPFLQLYH